MTDTIHGLMLLVMLVYMVRIEVLLSRIDAKTPRAVRHDG